ncbi:MAG: HEPN domain-containing protein [Dysgonamonadaceae bacterium]|jgi:uncharacterized protein (UPF0332 family)|nr:HEPN domain-containing protein [Dysgonamonadaceae bacterium]
MGLTEEERKSIINFRLEKAKGTFSEIKILIENDLWGNAINRLYYSCFYAASALLINDGHLAHTHNGVKSILASYVQKNKLDKTMIKLYGNLFNLRQRGDYEDWILIEESDVKPLIEPAKEFIATIENLLYEI